VVFLISDFETNGDADAARSQLRRAVRQTNRRHDLIAVHIEDPRELELPNVGIIALEDAESGEIIELDTARAAVRKRFNEVSLERALRLRNDLRSEGVDTVQLRTDMPYIPPLQRFFKARGRPRV
jgi:RNase P/RNase MRP subunit p30